MRKCLPPILGLLLNFTDRKYGIYSLLWAWKRAKTNKRVNLSKHRLVKQSYKANGWFIIANSPAVTLWVGTIIDTPGVPESL